MNCILRIAVCVKFCTLLIALFTMQVAAQDEYSGTFLRELVPNLEDTDKITLKQAEPSSFSSLEKLGPGTQAASGNMLNPRTGKESVHTVLIVPSEGDPIIYCDLNDDGSLGPGERFPMTRDEKFSNIWTLTVQLKAEKGSFGNYPVFLRLFRLFPSGRWIWKKAHFRKRPPFWYAALST